LISLVSTSISSSAAFPGGEAFHFSFSPNGHYTLAYSSSRLYVIDTSEEELEVRRELKILRRPASTTILDDGSLLAVLSTDHQVDLYDLAGDHPKHIRAVALDHPPRTIALSPAGSVLAAAFDGGVEVYSLSPTASVNDRRAVKCDAADALLFSQDGTQLLGTTVNSKNPSTVILTAPYFDPGGHMPEDIISQLWTTSILFPNSSRDCSHAVLIPNSAYDEVSWAFTYDRVFETFRAVRIDDLRNGTTYFTGPMADPDAISKLLPSTLPSATQSGDIVSSGFQGKEIWVYGLPEDLGAVPEQIQGSNSNPDSDAESSTSGLTRKSSTMSTRSHTWPRDGATSRIPQWQILCDKSRNTFIEGRKIGFLAGISAVKWVSRSAKVTYGERLIAVAPGVVGQQMEADEDGIPPVDGGRLSILDFGYTTTNGQRRTLTIEVGENKPEVLEEEHRDLEAEVAIVRRRTVAQKRGGRAAVLRSTTSAVSSISSSLGSSPQIPDIPPMPNVPQGTTSGRARILPSTDERSETASIDEDGDTVDAPYAHDGPRSGTTLRRAATAVAINRRLHPPRVVAQEHIQYRRADGREEHPHESDADNWVPPPPPYTKDAIAPLPEHLKNAVLAGSVPVLPPSNLHRSATQRTTDSAESDILTSLQRSRTTFVPRNEPSTPSGFVANRTSNESTSTTHSNDPMDASQANAQSDSNYDDLYDVSPPGTPTPEPADPIEPIVPSPPNLIPRRPVGLGSSPPNILPELVMTSVTNQPTSSMPQSPVLNNGNIFEAHMVPIRAGENEAKGSTASNIERVRPVSMIPFVSRSRLEAPVPERPNSDHRLSEPPPATRTAAMDVTPPLNNSAIMDRSRPFPPRDTSALMLDSTSTVQQFAAPYISPSAAQLARLNSRSARPRGSSDQWQRASGTYSQAPQDPSPRTSNPSHRVSVGQTRVTLADNQNYLQQQDPSRSSYGYMQPPPIPQSQHHSPARRPAQAPGRHGSSSQSNRPRTQRLETIHSATSQLGDHSSFPHVRSGGVVRQISGVGRHPSRAERSAAINIKEAKKRGWGKIKKKKKDKIGDGASTAGWTDLSRDSFGNERKDRSAKCSVM